jgi:hypothetical protein
MITMSRSARLAAFWMCVGVMPSAAKPMCKPAIAVTKIQFSEVMQQKRTWTAMLGVDASKCATASGDFSISFVRLSETAPDLEFTEPLTWRAGRMEVSVDFAAEEAVHAYWVNTMACPCRDE